MRTLTHPKAKIFVVVPVYGAYDVVQMCIDHLEKNTVNSLYYVLVDDGYYDPIPFHATEKRAIIRFEAEPPEWEHKEHIVRAMDLGLDYGRRNIAFDYFVKLETDVMVQPEWDKKLLQIANEITNQGVNWATLEGKFVDLALDDPPEYVAEQERIANSWEPRHYPIKYNQMNCCLFSPALMHKPWWFSMVQTHHDIGLNEMFVQMGGNMQNIETTAVWHKHYRGTSRGLMTRKNQERGFDV